MLAFRERSSYATAAMRATLIVVYTGVSLILRALLWLPVSLRDDMINTCLRKY